MFELRDYQESAIAGVYHWFDTEHGDPLVVVPTGGGKSVICAELIRRILEERPEERIMVVTHVKELIGQNHRTLKSLWPEAPAGIYSAGLKQRDTKSQVIFCGVQSTYFRTAELGRFDLIIVDECHLIPTKGRGMYQQLLSGLRETNPNVRLVGMTATPFRTDTGSLIEGNGNLFHGIAYECELSTMIKDGWLSPVTNKGVKSKIDTSKVKLIAGEFKSDELEAAAMAGDLVERSVDELISRSLDRKAWLIFACGIDHAVSICGELDKRGVVNTCVFGRTPRDDRDARIDAFRAGDITAMVNVGVLTTGFDVPHIDLIALMRPTQSPGLYVQMTGRGLRIADGKKDCLILDFGGNIIRHGPLDRVRPRKEPDGEGGEAPAKECPECLEIIPSAVMICPECGYEFESEEEDGEFDGHDETPDEASVLVAGKREPKEIEVLSVYYDRHKKQGKPDSMKVTYLCKGHVAMALGLRYIVEWVCFEHGPWMFIGACEWWRDRNGKRPPYPQTISDALARIKLGELDRPDWITVEKEGKYDRVVGVRYRPDPNAEDKWYASTPPSHGDYE